MCGKGGVGHTLLAGDTLWHTFVLRLEYVPTHGALLDPCHGNPPQTSLLFHKTSGGVARDRVIVKKRNLKTKADIDKIWTHVEGNKSIRLGKPGDAWKKEDGVHEPVVG